MDGVALAVEVREPLQDLEEDVREQRLGHAHPLARGVLVHVEQRARVHVLEREVDGALVEEGVVEADEVVAQRVEHHLHLAHQRVARRLLALEVLQHLERERPLRRPVRREVDATRRALAEQPPQVEVVEPQRRDLAVRQRRVGDAVLADREHVLGEGAGVGEGEGLRERIDGAGGAEHVERDRLGLFYHRGSAVSLALHCEPCSPSLLCAGAPRQRKIQEFQFAPPRDVRSRPSVGTLCTSTNQ